MNEYKVNIYAENGTIKETLGFSEGIVASEDIPFKQSKYQIHKDDSITQIKNKILLLYPEASYEELYVFAKIIKPINLQAIYQNIAKTSTKIGKKQKKTIVSAGFLDKKQFEQLLINLGNNDRGFKKKEYYDYGDLLKYGNFKTEFYAPIGVGLGMHFSKYHNYLFSANPYELVENYEPNLSDDKTNSIYFFDNELLFNNGNVEVIGAVFAEDAFKYAVKHGHSEEYIAKTYFPGLAAKGVFSLAELEKTRKPASISERSFETIDEFYKINQSALNFDQKGIRTFKFALQPDYDTLIPLEAIFKNIHATESIPFIKYNPGVRRDNICRIYSTEITRTGKKIPFLPHNKIIHLANTIGKHKQISIYEHTKELIVDIESDGVVYVSGDFSKSVSIDELDATIRESVNDILNKINGYLQNSGYKLPVIRSLRDDNVDFLTLDYVASISVKNLNMKLRKKIGCISTIFDIIDDTVNKGAIMRFKRVENFHEMDAQSATITEVFRSSRNEEDVIAALMQNYDINFEDAVRRISEYLKNVNYVERRHGSKSIDIIENPGLTVFLQYNTNTNRLTFRVDKLPHIEYIETLTFYFGALIQLYADEDNISEKMKELCDKKIEKAPKPVAAVILEHIDQVEEKKVKPKAFDINDYLPIQKQVSEKEDEEEVSPKPVSPKPMSSSASEEKELEEEIIEDEDVSLGSDEEFFGIEQFGGAKAAAANSDESETAQNTNYFLERLQERDPVLFLKKREGKFKVYSRSCQAVHQKQPVVLSDAEKAKIDENDKKNGKKSYTNAIKYGSSEDDDKKNWYICPRFWCFKTNTSMTKEQIDAGECGTNYHEFTEDVYHQEKGKYVDFSPGFLSEAHPKYCVPCCFSRWDSELHKKRRNQCVRDKTHIYENEKTDKDKDQSDSESESEEKPKAKPKNAKPRAKPKAKADTEQVQPAAKTYTPDYIEDGNIVPLRKNTWALAQKAVQHFMQIDYSENILEIGQKGHKSAYVKENKQTFLRYGVEQDELTYKNSLIGCLANVYANIHNKKDISIAEFIHKIADSITIDDFVKYGNGTFQTIFRPKTAITVNEINIDAHLESELFKKYNEKYKGAMLSNLTHKNIFIKIVAAYDNFINYLKNPKTDLDHTYVWDIASTPNTKLFPSGLNLVIMEIANNDMTHNIDVMCPTNAYSKNLFDEEKPTLFLAKQDRLFEPIYGYKYQGAELTVTRTFNAKSPLSSNIQKILEMMNNTVNNICKPKQSLPTKYLFENPILLSVLEEKILKHDQYTIRGQVMNFQGKIIALTIKEKGVSEEIYVPSHPSSPLPKYPIIVMDEPSLITSYKNTRDMLVRLSKASNSDIPCMPRMKIIENGIIMGILTETNQFIPVIQEPKMVHDQDRLISIEDKNYVLYDDYEKEITTATKEDTARTKVVRSVNLENDFYSVFRSTLKTLIISNNAVRNKVIELISNRTMKFKPRLNVLIRLFKRVLMNFVEFSESNDKYEDFIKTPYTCEGKKTAVFCDKCKLILSKKNLINEGVDNSIEYYYRVADETLRYGKIQQFMIYPKQFLSISSVEYKIADDEFIILEKFLFARNYFADMKPFKFDDHVKNMPFAVANPDPKISQIYSNSVSLEEQRAFDKLDLMENVNRCKKTVTTIAGEKNSTNYWQTVVFKKGTKLIVFKDSPIECSYGALYYILQDFYKRPITFEEIRRKIWEGYADLWNNEKYQKVIMNILKLQGKGLTVSSGDFERAMTTSDTMPEDYMLSVLDIWVVSQKFNIPTILWSPSTTLKQTGIIFIEKDKNASVQGTVKNPLNDPHPHRLSNSWIVMGRTPRRTDDKFYFVMSPSTEKKVGNEKNIVSEISMIYGSFVIDDLGKTAQSNDLGPKIRDALNGGQDYGARARPISAFFDEITPIIIRVPKKP
jgi:hypothetical protein